MLARDTPGTVHGFKKNMNDGIIASLSIIRNLDPKELNKILTSLIFAGRDPNDTPLHKAIRSCSSKSEIEQFLKEEENISQMARTINNDNCLPIDLIELKRLDSEEKKELKLLLIPFMMINPFKKLSEPVDSTLIVKVTDNCRLHKNLELGCWVANRARELIKRSSTHPEINTWNISLQHRLIGDVKEVQQISYLTALYRLCINPLAMMFSPISVFHQIKLNTIIAAGKGNCYEFACLALKIAKEQEPDLAADVCIIENSDHAFIILGKGSDTVVCDAWAGEVYSINEIPEKLKGYKHYFLGDQLINVITSYNPAVHSVSKISDQFLALEEIFSWQLLATGVAFAYVYLILATSTTPSLNNAAQLKP